MNNPSGLNQVEMMAMMGLLTPLAPNRERRRASLVGRLHADDNKPAFSREKRRKKNRGARRARAKNRIS